MVGVHGQRGAEPAHVQLLKIYSKIVNQLGYSEEVVDAYTLS